MASSAPFKVLFDFLSLYHITSGFHWRKNITHVNFGVYSLQIEFWLMICCGYIVEDSTCNFFRRSVIFVRVKYSTLKVESCFEVRCRANQKQQVLRFRTSSWTLGCLSCIRVWRKNHSHHTFPNSVRSIISILRLATPTDITWERHWFQRWRTAKVCTRTRPRNKNCTRRVTTLF